MQQEAEAGKVTRAVLDDTHEIDKVLKATTLGRVDELAGNLQQTLKSKAPKDLDRLKAEVKELEDDAAGV